MRNRSREHKTLKSLITFLQLPSKHCFLSAVLKEINLTFPREHVTTVLFSHSVHLNVCGSHLPCKQTKGALMAWHWLAINQIMVKDWDIKKKERYKTAKLD